MPPARSDGLKLFGIASGPQSTASEIVSDGSLKADKSNRCQRNAGVSDEIARLYSDAEVARLLDPTGQRLKARSIRSEREAGRLIGTKVAGKWLYSHADILN